MDFVSELENRELDELVSYVNYSEQISYLHQEMKIKSSYHSELFLSEATLTQFQENRYKPTYHGK